MLARNHYYISAPLDLCYSQLSFPFNNFTQKFVLNYFYKNPSKK